MTDITAEPEEEITDAAAEGGDDPAELSELEQIAADLGWKPESAWKGDKTNWTDAATFLRQTASKAETAKKEAAAVRKDVDSIVAKRVEAMEKTMRKSRERELQGVRSSYNAEIRKAIADGDDEYEAELRAALADAEGEYDDLNEVQLSPEELQKAEDKWVEEFPVAFPKLQKPFWQEHAHLLDEDADLDDFALIEAEISARIQKGDTLSEALDSADKLLRRTFPDRYEVEEEEPKPAKREARIPVIASASRSSGGKSLASKLPAEARKQAKKDIDAGLFGSYEEWTETYVSSGGELT